MQQWELVRRLLGHAGIGGQSFSPRLIAVEYHKQLVSLGETNVPDLDELAEEAEILGEELVEAGCLRSAPSQQGAAILMNLAQTDLGARLHAVLCSRNGVLFFEGFHAQVERGEIERLLHQLDS